MDDAREGVRKRKARPTLACKPCQRKKIRCDKKLPCSNCNRSKRESCSYSYDVTVLETDENRERSATEHTTPQLLRHAYDEISSSSVGQGKARPTNISSASGSSVTESYSKHLVHEHTNLRYNDTEAERLSTQIKGLQRQLQELTETKGKKTADPSSVVDTDNPVRGLFMKTRFFGQSHFLNSIFQFRQFIEVARDFDSAEEPEVQRMLDDCRKFKRAMKMEENASITTPIQFRDFKLSKATSDMLLKAYYRTSESIFQILHIPTFQTEYESYWEDPNSASEDFLAKLVLTMAIGLVFCPNQIEVTSPRATVTSWIRAAQLWLSMPFEKSKITTSVLQVHCLVIIARQFSSIGGDSVWMSVGSLLRTAMMMGLHIDPSHLPKMSPVDKEIRRRLWATVLELLVQSSLDVGGSPLISSADFDCSPPSNINDSDISDVTVTLAPKPTQTLTQSSFQADLAKSLKLRLEVTKKINGLAASPSYEEVLDLSSRLSSSCHASALLFRQFSSASESSDDDFRTKMHKLLVHRYLLALHLPYAIRAHENAMFYFSRKLSLDIAMELLSQHELSCSSSFSNDDFTQLEIVGGGLYRTTLIIACMVLYGELLSRVKEEHLNSFVPISSTFTDEEIRGKIFTYLELTATRIRAGERNIKGYIFAASYLAHVDALKSGGSIKQAIKDAYRDSIIRAHGLLKSQFDNSSLSLDDSAAVIGSLDPSFLEETFNIQDWMFGEYTDFLGYDAFMS